MATFMRRAWSVGRGAWSATAHQYGLRRRSARKESGRHTTTRRRGRLWGGRSCRTDWGECRGADSPRRCWRPARVEADVDARPVAAAEHAVGAEDDCLDRLPKCRIDASWALEDVE